MSREIAIGWETCRCFMIMSVVNCSVKMSVWENGRNTDIEQEGTESVGGVECAWKRGCSFWMNLQILLEFRQFLRIGRSDYRRCRYTQKPCLLRTRIFHLPHRPPGEERKSSRSVSFLNIFVPAIPRPITWCNVPGASAIAMAIRKKERGK